MLHRLPHSSELMQCDHETYSKRTFLAHSVAGLAPGYNPTLLTAHAQKAHATCVTTTPTFTDKPGELERSERPQWQSSVYIADTETNFYL